MTLPKRISTLKTRQSASNGVQKKHIDKNGYQAVNEVEFSPSCKWQNSNIDIQVSHNYLKYNWKQPLMHYLFSSPQEVLNVLLGTKIRSPMENHSFAKRSSIIEYTFQQEMSQTKSTEWNENRNCHHKLISFRSPTPGYFQKGPGKSDGSDNQYWWTWSNSKSLPVCH